MDKEELGAMFYAGRSAVWRSALGAFVFILASLQLTAAAIPSEWTQREFAKFRLLPNWTAVGGLDEVLIGLEVDLEPGWQFYSMNPGEFGVAPKFDWTKSHNLANVSIHWPKPTRYRYSIDPPASTLGYKGSLLLPVVLEPETVEEDLEVRLALEYAVCDEFCIIDTVGLRLRLPVGRSATTRHSARLQRALQEALGDAKATAW